MLLAGRVLFVARASTHRRLRLALLTAALPGQNAPQRTLPVSHTHSGRVHSLGAVLVFQASQADPRKTVAARGLVNGRGPPARRDGGRDSAKRVVFRGSACEPARTALPASSIPADSGPGNYFRTAERTRRKLPPAMREMSPREKPRRRISSQSAGKRETSSSPAAVTSIPS